VDLIHPASAAEVGGALRSASAAGRRVGIVGGRTHADRSPPRAVDAELWTTQLDATVAYDPAEMIAVVEAGMRVGTLQTLLHEGGQEWPVDAPDDATVGGVVAAGVSSVRRLRVGHVRDTVVELDLVTGDGRAVRSGARTVKNVTGFDIHRLATGSFGSLGAIVQVALKVRPLPQARRTLVRTGAVGLEPGRELMRAVPAATAILASPDRIELRLEGWAAEVEQLTAAAIGVDGELFVLEDDPFPARAVDDAPVVVEVAVPPSCLDTVVEGLADWTALIGVGMVWVRLPGSDDPSLRTVLQRAGAVGGTARQVRGSPPDERAVAPPLPAPDVQRRLKEAFDPAGILAPIPGVGSGNG
jgi:glycolate oxidase FAD binding subunit